jgi:hypothetical protein
MESILKHFESLGDNCEFGFVLQHYGIRDGGLFRWTMIRDFRYLVGALDGRLEGIFQSQNLAPVTGNLVRDSRYGIEFHTKMPIEQCAAGWEYATSFEGRRAVYEVENEKFQYLAEKFLSGAARASKVYVLKSIQPIDRDLIDAVLASLRKHGDVSILWVCEADCDHAPNSVETLSPHLYRGFVTRFSKRNEMDDIDMQSWAAVCDRAWQLHVSIHGETDFTEEAPSHPLTQPSSIPEWFNAKRYLLANPDVAEAGMDAGEHYIQFGWKERRLLRL